MYPVNGVIWMKSTRWLVINGILFQAVTDIAQRLLSDDVMAIAAYQYHVIKRFPLTITLYALRINQTGIAGQLR